MFNRNKTIFILLACALTFVLAAPAWAADDEIVNIASAKQQAIAAQEAAHRSASRPLTSALQDGRIRYEGKYGIPGFPQTAMASCAIYTNQCSDVGLQLYWLYNIPGSLGGILDRAGEAVLNQGLLPESLMSVEWYILYDPGDSLGQGLGHGGDPAITVTIVADDGTGYPDESMVLGSATRTFADWSADPDLLAVGVYREGPVDFDFSTSGIIIPMGGKVWAILTVDQSGGPAKLSCLSDEAEEAIGGGTCADGQPFAGAMYLTGSYNTWFTMYDAWGFHENWAMTYTLCTEQPPPVCNTLTNWCSTPTTFSNFGMPRTNRYAFANKYFGGQLGNAQACTVKTLYPYIYESVSSLGDTLTQADLEIAIYADGGGVPGALIWMDTILYHDLNVFPASVLNGPTVVTVPNVVVTGDFFVGYAAINAVGAATNVIGFAGSALGGGDAGCPYAAYNPDAMWVQNLPGLVWMTDAAFFAGAESELWVDVEICCPKLPFATCFPTTDNDWATRSNNFGRTNATSAMISDLCAITRVWSANVDAAPGVNPVLNISFTSPVIAAGKVLVSDYNFLRCYDQATGALLWSFGGFPYIGDDLRCNVTVEGDTAVYVGGASFRAFSKLRIADGSILWSRNAGGVDVPLGSGFTRFAPSVLDGGAVITIDEAGGVWKLDPLTGADLAASITLPDAPGAIPLDGLTGDGIGKIWVTTANPGTLSDGSIHQIDVGTWMIDWTLEDPSFKFFGDVKYEPEGFPGPLAYENGVLYYHSRIRDDANDNEEYPDKTAAIGKIDVALEDGTGAGILWVAAPPAGAVLYSGVTVGPGYIYTGHQGIWSGTSEVHGVAAHTKDLGIVVWTFAFGGPITEGENESGTVVNNLRVGNPITLICGMDGVPYLFVGDEGGGAGSVASGGDWRLFNGNTGQELWRRKFSGRVSGTAVVDGFLAVAIQGNANGTSGGGGSLVGFIVDAGRPRLQIDSEQVFRTATPGDGLSPINTLTDAISNTGCIDLNIASYTVVGAAPVGPGPARAIITDVNPMLSATAQRAASAIAMGGYDALLSVLSDKQIATLHASKVVHDAEAESAVRGFAEYAHAAADPVFLTVNTGPSLIPVGGTGTLTFQYDETGLSNNTMYINYILIDSDDPDFHPQDPAGAVFGDPYVQVTLFIGCPDDAGYLTLGLGEQYVSNFGQTADNGTEGIHINGHVDYHFDGGMAMVWGDSTMWAMDGVSLNPPNDASEWGPTLPCGVNIGSGSYANPIGGFDAVDTVRYNMIDLASSRGHFTTGERQMGGVMLTIQHVGSHDPAFGEFGLAKVTILNEADGNGTMTNAYFGLGQDWDVAPFGDNHGRVYPSGYAITNGGAGGVAASTAAAGDARLDANAVGSAILGSGGYSGSFMMADFFGYSNSNHPTGTGPHAFELMSTPNTYVATNYPGEVGALADVDLGAYVSLVHVPSLAEGATADVYYCTFVLNNGVNGLPWNSVATFDVAYNEVVCRAKAFAGFGKGDLNCDGCNDLADVVLLGNIVDGVTAASGAAIYTADCDGDNDIDDADYNLLYDVVSGVGGVLANAWRF